MKARMKKAKPHFSIVGPSIDECIPYIHCCVKVSEGIPNVCLFVVVFVGGGDRCSLFVYNDEAMVLVAHERLSQELGLFAAALAVSIREGFPHFGPWDKILI
jgi:hypothetical protein